MERLLQVITDSVIMLVHPSPLMMKESRAICVVICRVIQLLSAQND